MTTPTPAETHWHGLKACRSEHGPLWRDGGCLVCDECDGDEGHNGPHDCGHEAHR